jgi:hypothetical protein
MIRLTFHSLTAIPFSGNLSTPAGVVARMEGLLNPLDKVLFPLSSSLPIRFLLPSLIILPFPNFYNSAHLSHVVARLQVMHRLALQSRACINMCRHLYKIFTFFRSSATEVADFQDVRMC